MAERHDANGPVILWIDYGSEGWVPYSFDAVEEALHHQRFGGNFRITRVVKYEVREIE